MSCRLNFLHSYAWEESGFPQIWVDAFNHSLQGVMVISEHVRKILIDNGVFIPIAVNGSGVDHWERIQSRAMPLLSARKFRFLHVSSCFPRKGVDVMLKAFGKAFRNTDDVVLIVKTFKNPHNEIHRWLEEAKNGDPAFPEVLVLEGEYSDEELKGLYEQCNVLVAASCAEGFGLPMAEAMLSGLAVITTNWSGQLDFCTSETAWLVNYSFEKAETHFGLFNSAWAKPDMMHLAQLMREVFELPESTRDQRTTNGRNLLLKEFRWEHAAEKMVHAARKWSCRKESPALHIGWISTWNTRCGIAEYSRHLIEYIPGTTSILAARTTAMPEADQENIERCWDTGEQDDLTQMRNAIEKKNLNILVVQFNYGFFKLETLSSFLVDQIDQGRVVIVMMHSTTDPVHVPHKKLDILVPALSRCHRVLVHGYADLNRLKNYGLVDNVALFPHGVIDFDTAKISKIEEVGRTFTIASYGFFLPHKGLVELVESVHLLKQRGINIRLNMINAEFPVAASISLVKEIKEKIQYLKLEKNISVCTDFLEDFASFERLKDADLIIFPYQNSGESSSAAVRYGIATGRPVAVTPLAIFEDVMPVVHCLSGTSSDDIANGIEILRQKIISHDATIMEKMKTADSWRATYRYPMVSKRLYGMLLALHKQR
jgi:glycosyltransferase involved in cell wall biosynthesis